MMARVAITGATGLVGRFLVREFSTRKFEMRALARPTSSRAGFPATIDWVEGTLTDPEALAALVRGMDAVVHLAYAHVPGRYRGGEGRDLAGWLDANLTGTQRLLLAARDAGLNQFIFLSSRAVFSRTEPGRVLDESHPISPSTHYGAYKAAVEALLRGFAAVEGMQTTSIRATGVYGKIWPVEKSKWWPIVRAVVAGEPVTSTRGGTEVHGEDVAHVIGALLAQPAPAPDIIHLSDLYVTHRQIVELAQRAAGVRGPLPPLPDVGPQNVLVCPRLAGLGITLGGLPKLESTIRELVEAAEAET